MHWLSDELFIYIRGLFEFSFPHSHNHSYPYPTALSCPWLLPFRNTFLSRSKCPIHDETWNLHHVRSLCKSGINKQPSSFDRWATAVIIDTAQSGKHGSKARDKRLLIEVLHHDNFVHLQFCLLRQRTSPTNNWNVILHAKSTPTSSLSDRYGTSFGAASPQFLRVRRNSFRPPSDSIIVACFKMMEYMLIAPEFISWLMSIYQIKGGL